MRQSKTHESIVVFVKKPLQTYSRTQVTQGLASLCTGKKYECLVSTTLYKLSKLSKT